MGRCFELGAEDYLFKPVNPVLLRARVAPHRHITVGRRVPGRSATGDRLLQTFADQAVIAIENVSLLGARARNRDLTESSSSRRRRASS